MARTKGSYTLSANIETNAAAPLDARERVATKSDLTASGSFPYAYVGMETYVVSEGKKYRLTASDYTQLSNWEEISSGGGTTVIANPVGEATADLETVQIGNIIYEIVGSSGSGDGFKITKLFDSGSNTSGAAYQRSLSLSDNLSNYDIGLLLWSTSGDRGNTNNQSADYVYFDIKETLNNGNYGRVHFAGYFKRWGSVSFTDTSFNFFGRGADQEGSNCLPEVYKIFGIKFNSGNGTKVIANPTGTSVGNLTKIQIGDDIYSITGGGGGGASYLSDLDDVLVSSPSENQSLKYDSANHVWKNRKSYVKTILYDSGTDTSYAEYGINIQLLDSVQNYDELLILISNPSDGGLANYSIPFYVDAELAIKYEVNWSGYWRRWLQANFSQKTSFTYNGGQVSESDGYRPRIYKIYGIKY